MRSTRDDDYTGTPTPMPSHTQPGAPSAGMPDNAAEPGQYHVTPDGPHQRDRNAALKYKLNPCDMDRYPVLAPLGDVFASVTKLFTVECNCCTGARILVGIAASFALGGWLL